MNYDRRNRTTDLVTIFLIVFVFGNMWISAQSAPRVPAVASYRFINGNWFNGKEFVKKTFYSVNGVFSSTKPKRVDSTVDLKNAFVLPPFGDAHNHTIELPYNFESFTNKLFADGIFYLKNPNSVPRFTKDIIDKVNRPNSIDAVFAGGGLTAKGGHPSVVYDEVLAKGPFKWLNITNYNGLAYHVTNDKNDLEAKWEAILAGKPDFIKTYVLFSEEYEERRDKDVDGFKGLDPELLPLIVEKAHAAGLRVSTHINTAFDFGVAVRAGVDEINHLPGIFSNSAKDFESYVINEDDAKLAGEKGIYVVPTYSLFLNNTTADEEASKKAKDVQKRNLRLLRNNGVRIVIGTDSYSETSQREAFYLRDLGVFTNFEIIKMWSENTPQTIFPARKITKLEDGYEASFISMPGNPLENLEAVKDIRYRFKQGVPIKNAEKK